MTTPPISALLQSVEWAENPDQKPDASGLPYATHSGVLRIGEIELRVHRLSTGQAIIEAEDFERFFGGLVGD